MIRNIYFQYIEVVKPEKNSIFLKKYKKKKKGKSKRKMKEETGSKGREGGEKRERKRKQDFFRFSLRFMEIRP